MSGAAGFELLTITACWPRSATTAGGLVPASNWFAGAPRLR